MIRNAGADEYTQVKVMDLILILKKKQRRSDKDVVDKVPSTIEEDVHLGQVFGQIQNVFLRHLKR